MRSTRLAEEEDWEDDDMKRIAAAKGGEKQKSAKAKKQDELRSSPRGGAYCVATRQLTSQATRGDGLEAEVKRQQKNTSGNLGGFTTRPMT
jgi:hypothetical protein